MAFTQAELDMLAKLEQECIAEIAQTNWSDRLLSDLDKQLIGMAVSWTYAKITERLDVIIEDLPEDDHGDGEEGDLDPRG